MKIFIADREDNILAFLYSQDRNIDWNKEIEDCKIRAFYYLIGKKYRTSLGDKIIHDPLGEYPEPFVNKNIEVLYEDDYFVAFDKPSPLPMHPSGAYVKNTFTYLAQKKGYDNYLINRLDAETSGIVVMAKNKAITSNITASFLQGEKWYVAMVYGKFPRHLSFQCLLGPKLNSRVKKKKGINLMGKISKTRFFCQSSNNGYSLVLANPKTGRTHQIRAHLNELGYPVVGDKIYGKSEDFFIRYLEEGHTETLLKELELDRQFLHCYKVQFKHPILDKKIRIKSNLPKKLLSFAKNKMKG